MGKSILLLRLEGPLQSWGVRSRWDVRDTGPEPTKSGVVGLLGCALGYPVGDPRLEALDRGLRLGVRVESPGRVMVDYQTVTDFLPTAEGTYRHSGVKTAVSLEKVRADPRIQPATIISPRSYLEDAAFLVALEDSGTQPDLVARCAEAMQRPVWPIYLGRKACLPTRPVFEAIIEEYDGLEEALTRYLWSWLGACGRDRAGPIGHLAVYVEDPAGELVRQDAVRTNQARQYGFRHARHLQVSIPSVAQGGRP